ncbi:MAG: lysylphosphatidylglycerol synthase transmembrane domain-containing protein [Candidatus Ratteibacteria bacterium]|nr:lysylphosphatidylglycerol synthase transmembrane domain-containing protein [Candidatus Ratteibacteria bacterium]
MNKKILFRLLGPVIFLLIIYFFVDLNQLKDIILKIKLLFFTLSIILSPVVIFIRSIRWRRILKKFKVTYSIGKCFRIYFVEMVAIMVIPIIGTFVKAVYPKRDGHGFLRPILSIISEKYFDYLLLIIFGVISVILTRFKMGGSISIVILLLVACSLFIPAKQSIVFLFSQIIPKWIKKLFSERGWDISKHTSDVEKSLDPGTYVLSITGFGVYFIAVYYLIRSLNINLDFSQVVLIMSITSLVTLIPISFLGIGTWDMALIVVFKWFGHTPEEAVALSIALLLLRVAIVFMGAIFWFIDPPPFLELKRINKYE